MDNEFYLFSIIKVNKVYYLNIKINSDPKKPIKDDAYFF